MWQLKAWADKAAFRKLVTPFVYLLTVCEVVLSLRRNNVGIVHVVGCSLGAQIFGLSALIARRKVICEPTLLGDDDALTLKKKPGGFLRIWVLKRMSMIVCLSPALASGMKDIKVSPDRIVVIGNGVDIERFAPVAIPERTKIRGRLKLPKNAFIFVTTGPLVPRKGMVELIEQFSRVAARNASLYLVIVGPTEYPEFQIYQDGLEAIRLRYGAKNRVIFAGKQADVVPWLQAADAFVFASRAEGFSTAIVEAMACGLPVILRDIPGISHYIAGPVAEDRIVDTDAALGDAMGKLAKAGVLDSDRSDMRTRAVSNFSTSKIIASYIDVYSALCRTCSPPPGQFGS